METASAVALLEGLEKLLRLSGTGQGQAQQLVLVRGSIGLVVIICPCCDQSCWPQCRGTCQGPAQLGPQLAVELAWQAYLGTLWYRALWVTADWYQLLSQAAVGGHGRQMAWCPGWFGGFTGLGPQGVVWVWYLPLQSRQWLSHRIEETRACLSLHLPISSCNSLQLHPRTDLKSHTVFE